jgi:glycerol-3-phosphate dehydrogenase
MAPHLIRPMRFVLPVEPGLRPAWMLRLGLFLYDHLGGRRSLPPTRRIDLSTDALGAPLQPRYRTGFEYSDCQVDDARLVVLNAVDAAERGAAIRTRTRCLRAERATIWRLVLDARGHRETATARVLVNATGPWLGQFAAMALERPSPAHLRLDKGSHIVVRRLFAHEHGYIFQAADRRVVFALPFAGDFTLVGTTDQSFSGDLSSVEPSAEEIDYLCAVVNEHFRAAISPADVIWSFAGVRSLYDDGSSKAQDTTRDYVLSLDDSAGAAPLLTVYGGKITTYRKLAEAALQRLGPVLGVGADWTAASHLPGGDVAPDGVDQLLAQTRRAWPFLAESHARRLVAAYGTHAGRVLGTARNLDDLGPRFGADLTGAEVRYLMGHEWAETADDVIWRRSKLGLRLPHSERERLARFMTETVGGQAPG